MSRWAEMFAALSAPADTIDTKDTTPTQQAPPRNCVHSVHCVRAIEDKAVAPGRIIPQQPAVSAADDPDERAVLVEVGAGVPRTWAEGFTALCAIPAPAGFMPERWRRVIGAAGVFLNRWSDTAIACGWSDLDVFGCHPTRPDARFDCMGLVLLLDRCVVVGIDPEGATLETATGARQHYRRRALPAGTVPLCELAS